MYFMATAQKGVGVCVNLWVGVYCCCTETLDNLILNNDQLHFVTLF